jgi:PAS domain S-box-containing protein
MFYATAPQVDQKIIRRSFVKKKTRLTNPMTSNFENRKSENDALVRQILETVGNRLNPIIKLGPVDDSCSFIITDAFARITFVSKTFTQTTGYSADEVLGKNPRFLQSPGGNVDPGSVRKYSDNNVISHMKASIEKVKECQYSLVNYRKNGEPFINLVSIIPIRLYSNDVSHFLGLQIDLVEHPESIVERMNDGNYYVNYSRKDGVDYSIIPEDFTMAQSPVEEMPIPVFHSQFIDNCGDLVYILSIRGLVLYTSPKSCKDVLGFDSEELQGQHIAELVHPSDLVFVQRELRSSAPKEVINLICRFKTKNGGYTTLDLRGHVYQGEAGKRTRCIVMSGREKKTGSLLLSDILTPSLDDSEVWAKISPQGLFLFADPGSEDVFGVSPESIYAKSLLDFVNENDKVRVRQALEYASGVVRFFDIVNLPLNTPKGHIISHIRIYNLSDDTGVATKHLLLQIKLVVDSSGVNYRISTKTLTDFSQFFINGNILDYQDGSSSIYYEINQLRVENKKLRDRLDDYKKKVFFAKLISVCFI